MVLRVLLLLFTFTLFAGFHQPAGGNCICADADNRETLQVGKYVTECRLKYPQKGTYFQLTNIRKYWWKRDSFITVYAFDAQGRLVYERFFRLKQQIVQSGKIEGSLYAVRIRFKVPTGFVRVWATDLSRCGYVTGRGGK
jgi:hypothetical protein